MENIWFLKRFLTLLHFTTGLKVHIEKCCLFWINIEEECLLEYAEILGCSVGSLPFTYLGVKVGSAHMRVVEWATVLQKVRNRLLKWNHLKVSIGERYTLLNVVLSSLPVYYLSTYRAPKKVLNEITKMQRKFFWGGGVSLLNPSLRLSGNLFVNPNI